MFLAIDGIPLIRQPHTISVRPGSHEVSMTADQRPLVRPGSEYSTIECTWGDGVSYQDVLLELRRLRANRGTHSISFYDPSVRTPHGETMTLNAFMGVPPYDMVRQDVRGKFVIGAFTIPFIQIDTPTFLFPLEWSLPGIIAIVSPFCTHYAPAAGRIVAVEGWILDLGAGAGQTSIQLRNETRAVNYLSTEGDFVCAPPNRQMQNHVLGTDLDFNAGDELRCNVTDIPGGGMSTYARITAWTLMRRP